MRAADVHADEVVYGDIAAGAAADEHSIVAVAGDVVARRQDGAADGSLGALDLDAIGAIGQGGVAAGVEAQEIALDQIAAGTGVNQHAVARVARNVVASAVDTAADGIVGAGILDTDLV